MQLPGGAASVRTAQTIPTATTDEELHPGAIRKAGAAEETALLNGIRRAGQKDPEEDKTFCDAGVNCLQALFFALEWRINGKS